MSETAKIPKSKEKLQRPTNERHALARIESDSVWVTSRNRELAEHVAALVTSLPPVTVSKSSGVIVWGHYCGSLQKDGTLVLDRKSDGRFKLLALDTTPYSLLEEMAHLVGIDGTVTSKEGRHGLVYRGIMRSADESIAGEVALSGSIAGGSIADGVAEAFEDITGLDAAEAIRQKVSLEFLEAGVKVRIRGKQKDCEAMAATIVNGSPTVSSQQGAKYMIEGNLHKSYLKKGPNQQGPNDHGVYMRDNLSERTFTAFGENLPAVLAACKTGAKEESIFSIVINDRSAGFLVISSGKRKAV